MRESWIRLAHVGMHPDRLRGLVSDSGSPVEVLRAVERGTLNVPPAARAAGQVSSEQREDWLADRNIRFLLRNDPGFPDRLAELPDCPFFLFQRGADVSNRCVAIVGTRSSTAYGRNLAHEYGRAVSQAGWAVVSGLARGIDGAAHRGSLVGGTPGLAVLGSGIDVWYPAEHASLGTDLLGAGGTVWSESPPGMPPVGWRVPPRNRLISGVAEAVIVVEAGVKGGALITARTALEQGREVCATPGDVGRASSEGCNLLIRDGANPVHDASDLIDSLDLMLGAPNRPKQNRHSGVDGPADGGVPIVEFLAELDPDPVLAIAQLGRLETAREVVVSDGVVTRNRATGEEKG